MTTRLSQSFHGDRASGEGAVPGSGGNLNSVYEGSGMIETEASDEGYGIGAMPVGQLSSGAEQNEFRISDSAAFNNLRGIAKTNYPFDPYPAQDHPNQQATSLVDNFEQSDVSGVSSLLPGKYSYNNQQGSLSNEILREFDAGSSTYNSLNTATTENALDNTDSAMRVASRQQAAQSGIGHQSQEGINPQSVSDQHKMAFSSASMQDVPLTPFHRTYPNFGQGHVDYGFQEPGADRMSDEIIRAYHAVLPQGQLAGAKKDLMPVFSGINQEAIEQRPILQSLGKLKNTLWLGGVTELPDQIRIDPRQALHSGSNVPADIVQSAGELASAFDSLKFYETDSLSTSNPYGAPLPNSTTLAGGSAGKMDPQFYSHLNYASDEPLTFAGQGHEYTSTEGVITSQ
jgi:hypothetical protein